MSSSAYDQLVTASLSLPPGKRGELASILLGSLQGEMPEGQGRTPEEWREEIGRRSDELNAGAAELIEADVLIPQARARVAEMRRR